VILLLFSVSDLLAQEHDGFGIFGGYSNIETTYSDSGDSFVPAGGTFGGIDL